MPVSTPRPGRKPSDRKTKATNGGAPTSVSAWKAKAREGKEINLTLPSGNVVAVKRIPLTQLLELNIFPDSLAGIVSEKTAMPDGTTKTTPVKPDEAAVQEMSKDPKELFKLLESTDRVTALSFVEPPALFHKQKVDPDVKDADAEWEVIPEEDRDEDALYTDEISLEDKFFVFQFTVGGSSDLDSFRAEFGATMGSLGDGQGLQL